MYILNENRKEYVYSMFMYNKHLVLDWDRRQGKSNYSVTCILDYAINHPNSNSLISGYCKESSENLAMKMIKCNFDRLQPILIKYNKFKMEFINGSTIYYNKMKDDIRYDTILIDEIDSFDLKYQGKEYFFKRLSEIISSNTMILSNCTNYNTNNDSVKMFDDLLKNLNIPITVEHFVSDEEISYIMRRKKIEKIKNLILE